jgi:hypothetical protein
MADGNANADSLPMNPVSRYRWLRCVLTVTLVLASQAGRAWAYAVMAVPLMGAAWVHLVWLPRHGVSGWTAERRDRHLALVKRR